MPFNVIDDGLSLLSNARSTQNNYMARKLLKCKQDAKMLNMSDRQTEEQFCLSIAPPHLHAMKIAEGIRGTFVNVCMYWWHENTCTCI